LTLFPSNRPNTTTVQMRFDRVASAMGRLTRLAIGRISYRCCGLVQSWCAHKENEERQPRAKHPVHHRGCTDALSGCRYCIILGIFMAFELTAILPSMLKSHPKTRTMGATTQRWERSQTVFPDAAESVPRVDSSLSLTCSST
jgi:hypothetical protein